MKNLQKFISSFNLKNNDFTDPVILEDLKFGFTTTKQFKDNYFSMIRVFIRDEDLENDKLDRKPIFFRASFTLKQGDKFLVVTNQITNKKTIPIDLISRDDYYYNISQNLFYKKDEKTSGEKALNEIYQLHIKPSKKIRGFYLRNKLRFLRFPSKLAKLIERFCYYLLIIIAGEKYDYSVFGKYTTTKQILDTDKKETDKKLTKDFSLFGYSASFWSMMSYSGIHLIFFTIFFVCDFRPQYLTTIFTNSFLTAIYVVFSLGLFEIILPKILKVIIEHSSKLYFRLSLKEIKL